MKRQIQGPLHYARQCPPVHAATRKAQGAKAQGLRYERSLRDFLGLSARHGLWWEFSDQKGRGYCQTDFLIKTARGIFILESKYTWTEEAQKELDGLYIPVLRKALNCTTYGLVVCKVLSPGAEGAKITSSLSEAMFLLACGDRVVWHWMGLETRNGASRHRLNAPLDLESLGL